MMCPLFVASDLSVLLAAAGQSVGREADHALSASGPGAGHDDSRGRAASHEWRDQLDSAAESIGCAPRTVRRWRWRYEHIGYDGLLDRRRGRPSPRRAPFAEVQRVLQLYRAHYVGFNGRHFHQIARRDHGVTLSYTYVKTALQRAGLLPTHRARGRHRRRRDPRPCFGELVHLDGSRHRWLSLVPERFQTLIVAVDDATKRLLYAQLVEGGESLGAIMTALRTILERDGIPGALYT